VLFVIGITSNLNVRYLRPVLLGKGNIVIKASLLKKRRNLVDIIVEIIDSENIVCAEATVTYFTFPTEVAKKNFNYPDYNEFFENS
jgi:acyl-coenzyme A thioesterase PaaI-like protein